MKQMLNEMRIMLRSNRGSILVFDIIYRIFSALILMETVGRGIQIALKYSGFSYLTARNALRFFCMPVTILFLVFFVLLCVCLATIEMCVLYTAFQAGVSGQKLSSFSMFIFGLKNFLELFKTKNIRTMWVNGNFYLLTGSWMILGLLKHTRPMNYILTELLGMRLVKVSILLLLVIMCIFASSRLFVPSISVFRDVRYKTSREESRRIFQKNRRFILFLLITFNIGVWGVYYVLQLVLKVAAALLVVLFADNSLEYALVLTVSKDMDLLALAAASIISAFGNHGILSFLHYHYQDEKYRLEIPPYHYIFSARFRKTAMIFTIAGFVVAAGIFAYDSLYKGTIKPSSVLSEAQITSHRGNSYEAPENTIPAIEKAIDSMSDYAEIDVQETKDGIVVLFHDASIKRITGQTGKLWEYTYGDLLLFDFGGWFSDEYINLQIPTLDEVLKLAKGKIKLNIELKSNRHSDTLVDEVLRLIEDNGMENQVVLCSTSYRYLKEIREKNPDLYIGYILSAAYGNFFDDENVDFFSIRSNFVTAQLVKSAHEYGKEIHVWTVNTRAELSRMKRLQVDNIITDRPVLAREILYKESETESIFYFISLALRG